MSNETQLEKIINAVDKSFAGSKKSAITTLISIGGITAAGVLAVALAILLSRVAAVAVLGGLLDTGINILALSVATGALGLSLLISALTFDWDKQGRRIDHRNHYGKLKEHRFDSLTLHTLIMMKTMLPRDVTLQQARIANPTLFILSGR